MRPQAIDSPNSWLPEIRPRNGVLVISGYGVDIRVWRGYLRISYGVGRSRRNGIVHRSVSGLERLVVIGHTGAISLDAIRWLADVGAGYSQIDEDSRVVAAFGPRGTNRPALIRAQALAADRQIGVEITRRLLREKLRRQRECLALEKKEMNIPGADAAGIEISAAEGMLEAADAVGGLRLAEARAAAAYWGAWSGIEVMFARRDEAMAPAHWRTFTSRSSVITGGPRLAVSPANAILNYLYSIVEAESAIAARAVGLDPGLGVLHADQPNRDSLADDLMEPVRPLVDRYVLRLLASRRFALSDFHETRQGVCRVTTRLARELAEAAQAWRPAVGAVAEDVGAMLGGSGEAPGKLATPLSGRNRSAGRGASSRPRRHTQPEAGRSCAECGSPTLGRRSTCSDACEEAARARGLEAFVAAGTRVLSARHGPGAAPELTEAGRGRLREAASGRVAEAREWQRGHAWPSDPGAFGRDVLPRLTGVPVRELVEATGLSEQYCRRIKRGLVVPHPMWWERLGGASRGDTDGAPATSEMAEAPVTGRRR